MLERINWIKELWLNTAPDKVPSSKWQGHSPFKAEMLGSTPAGIISLLSLIGCVTSSGGQTTHSEEA